MRKLNILKAIVDFVWIMSFIAIPLLILFLGYVLINDEPFGIPININGIEVAVVDQQTKILLVFIVLAALLIIYSLYLFRKILLSFQKLKIFDLEVIKNFNRIGILLLVSALLSGVPAFIVKFLKREVSLEIGLNPFILFRVIFYGFKRSFYDCKNSKRRKRINNITMPIIVNLDVMLAKRKMKSNELAEKVGITVANLSILKTGKAKAIRFSTLEAICDELECQPADILEYVKE